MDSKWTSFGLVLAGSAEVDGLLVPGQLSKFAVVFPSDDLLALRNRFTTKTEHARLGARDLSVGTDSPVIAAVLLGFAVGGTVLGRGDSLRARFVCRLFDRLYWRFSARLFAVVFASLIGAAIDYLNISDRHTVSFLGACALNLRARLRSRLVSAPVFALPSRAAFRVSPDLTAPATASVVRATSFDLRASSRHGSALVSATLDEALMTLLDVRAPEHLSSSFAACLNWAGLRKLRADERCIFLTSRGLGRRRLSSGRLGSRWLGGRWSRLTGLMDSVRCFAFCDVSANVVLLSSSHSGDFRCLLGGFISTLEVVSFINFATTLFELVTLLAGGTAKGFQSVALERSVSTAFSSKELSLPAVAESVSASRVSVVKSSPFVVNSSG